MPYKWYVRIIYKDGTVVERCHPDTDTGAKDAHHEWLYYSQPWRPGDPKDKRNINMVIEPERRFVSEDKTPSFSLTGTLYKNVRIRGT